MSIADWAAACNASSYRPLEEIRQAGVASGFTAVRSSWPGGICFRPHRSFAQVFDLFRNQVIISSLLSAGCSIRHCVGIWRVLALFRDEAERVRAF
jgi:hypothetical protein